jgi:hypothetical protein
MAGFWRQICQFERDLMENPPSLALWRDKSGNGEV